MIPLSISLQYPQVYKLNIYTPYDYYFKIETPLYVFSINFDSIKFVHVRFLNRDARVHDSPMQIKFRNYSSPIDYGLSSLSNPELKESIINPMKQFWISLLKQQQKVSVYLYS